MLFVGTSIIHPSTEGVFLLCNILDLLIYSKNKTAPKPWQAIAQRFCSIDICKGGFTMKKIGLGIAILLFAIIISLCSSGMGLLVIGIGIVGLIFSIIGFMERK